ncbi:MAG: AMP-binding protein, partial [Bacteroidia bacterium]
LAGDTNRFEFQSSGSTGAPKVFTFSRAQIKISASQTIDFFKLERGDVLLCPFSMDFVAAKMMVARAFFLKATLVFTGPVGNPFLIDQIPEVSFVALVPLQLQKVLNNKDSLVRLNKAKSTIIGGAAVSYNLQNEIANKVESAIYQTYGMTETLTHIAVKDLQQLKGSYKLLKGVKISVDFRTCLKIKSPLNSSWLQTNDLVELIDNGFKWLGRIDNVINSAGFKINIELLEEKVNSSLTVNQYFICGIDSDLLGEECVALTVNGNLNDLKNAIEKANLHPYEKPKKLVLINEFPFNKNGKILRVQLKKLANANVLTGQYQNLI